MMSAQPDAVSTVIPDRAISTAPATRSLRAASHAARVREPPSVRTRASRATHTRFTRIEPTATPSSTPAAGGSGSPTFVAAMTSAATAGSTMIPAMTLPMTACRAAVHPSATKISRLTAKSSKKSTESATRATEPIPTARMISTTR